MKLKNYASLLFALCVSGAVFAQERHKAVDHGLFGEPIYVESIAKQIEKGTFFGPLESGREQKVPDGGEGINPKLKHVNNIIPGKGLPKHGDPLARNPEEQLRYPGWNPLLVFEANISNFTPSDPTGAVGPNHYIGGWNVGFRIFDKDGNPLTPAASLGTIFPGNVSGDPIILYDAEADRFVITQFAGFVMGDNFNGFNVAISEGPDPVNDGWYVYQNDFNTGNFPDYTKFSIWHDGYYVTANIGGSNRLFVIEREEMLDGNTAQYVSLPLPGIVTSGFYSPQVFSALGDDLPQTEATVVYMQDDAWGGVSSDHLKLWTVSVDWNTPGNSSVSTAVQLPVTNFVGVFDGGAFSNLPQPGSNVLIDCLQATIMNQAQLRKFDTYNAAVFNFVVDILPGSQKQAGIRWYELRQPAAGGAWTIHQEGTYISTGQKSAFAGSMALDIHGNIGMGYTTVGTLDEVERIAIKCTGRYEGDPLGQMTVTETPIGLSTVNNPNTRYADYAHLTVDPADGETFWFNTEYFAPQRKNLVSAFKIAPMADEDVGPLSLVSPESGPLTNAEEIIVNIRNFGTIDQSNFDISYSIDGSAPVTETFTGTITALSNDEFTFATPADLSQENHTYEITVTTNLTTDGYTDNDSMTFEVKHIPDVGLNDNPIPGSDFVVLSKGDNQFEAILSINQAVGEKVFIDVYTMQGQQVLFNLLEYENGSYSYKLDMSYASAGVYMVRVGTINNGSVKKIIVR